MREFVFTLEYAPGTNAVADILRANPQTKIRSLACHVTHDDLWRVDHITGGRAHDEFINDIGTADYHPDCLYRGDCDANWDTQVLDRTEDSLVLYSYWSCTNSCSSTAQLALEHLGSGLIFQTRWVGSRYEWRIIAPDDAAYGPFHEAVENEIDDTSGVTFVRVGDADDAIPDESDASLTPEQDAAVRAAVEHGYYHTPREIETYELAENLGIPGSTLSYRLRRAEALLADAYVADHAQPAALSAPDS